jgi:Rrf2 family protein
MHVNSRFAVAVHALGLTLIAKAEAKGEAVTSERLASIVNTNPVVVRRVLGALREAGLVTSQPGPGGGWKLTRDAASITLADVYRAVEGESKCSFPHRTPSETCPFGERLPEVLEQCFREAEAAMEHRLSQVTIADVLDAVRGGRLFWEPGSNQAAVNSSPLSISQ